MRLCHTALAAALLCAPAAALAAPYAAPGFTVSVFAKSPKGLTRPDSLAVVGNHIWVGYGNGGNPLGTGAISNIVEYTFAGKIVRTLSLVGHNDGMRLDPFTHQIWALQNEDGNSTLLVIDPVSGARTHYRFPPDLNGGGYDDVTFRNGIAYVSASNPTLNAAGKSAGPALVSVVLNPKDHSIAVTPVRGAAHRAIDTATGQSELLNLTDPDSLTQTPSGDLLLDSQGDGELVRIQQSNGQVYVTHLLGGVQVDDTAFATSSHGFLLVSDKPGNVIYRINSPVWAPGTAYSAMSGVSGTQSIAGYVGQLDFASGELVPIVSGLDAGAGMIFVPAP
ncbi:MAG: hypothetical protein ACP5NI_06640 [Acetobacteraceae bacterium]